MADDVLVTVSREAVESADAQALMAQLSTVLQQITGDSGQHSFNAADLQHPAACFAVARDQQGNALGCGAIRPLTQDVAELKRMFAREGAQGTGSALLHFLEAEAATLGYREIWLETRRVNQQAVRFYLRRGYQPIASYGRYIGNPEAQCFAKTLR
ncbi:GNAT family N-acetyltransferase [Erwinia sp. V71]|uniref:GNAT family N-acetyltransferase n=1 Tax=Erwinia sp. V71 TaxID=3369424 RepID=UPI003F632AC1